MANLEEEITNLKANLQRQEDIIEQRLRVVSLQLTGIRTLCLQLSSLQRRRGFIAV